MDNIYLKIFEGSLLVNSIQQIKKTPGTIVAMILLNNSGDLKLNTGDPLSILKPFAIITVASILASSIWSTIGEEDWDFSKANLF